MSSRGSQLFTDNITIGFEDRLVELPLKTITPTRVVTKAIKVSIKYKRILSSIREIGVIEPLVVTEEKGTYYLLDGHVRLQALQDLEQEKTLCLISSDDESFTYNKHINRLAPIQEHKMILKAVERGVSEDKIAAALNLDVKSIIMKRNLLKGICDEAAEILKDKIVPGSVFNVLKRMKPLRQVEAATLMVDANSFNATYAKAILGSTPKDQLKNPEKPKSIKGLTPEQMARMENEMASLQREYKLIEEGYGADVLSLTFAKGYLSNLLENTQITRYLSKHHPNILNEFQRITEISSLREEVAA
ncbi:MAG: plasmid partitioning protein RepB C-terminal domain-containing protein [Rickettsiales bacterium]|nr:plasmid partitioning protein RepB C-terminal domain-containing protein [Rickettsiales bacterium]